MHELWLQQDTLRSIRFARKFQHDVIMQIISHDLGLLFKGNQLFEIYNTYNNTNALIIRREAPGRLEQGISAIEARNDRRCWVFRTPSSRNPLTLKARRSGVLLRVEVDLRPLLEESRHWVNLRTYAFPQDTDLRFYPCFRPASSRSASLVYSEEVPLRSRSRSTAAAGRTACGSWATECSVDNPEEPYTPHPLLQNHWLRPFSCACEDCLSAGVHGAWRLWTPQPAAGEGSRQLRFCRICLETGLRRQRLSSSYRRRGCAGRSGRGARSGGYCRLRS